MTTLFWDIDGTLLTTGRAGVFAWNDAVLEVTGHTFDLAATRTAGLTDYQIGVRTLESLGLVPTADLVARLVGRYEDLLPASLPKKQGQVLPHVREILDHVRALGSARSLLLTGNTRRGAGAKLRYYGLLDYFPDGAFAEDPSARSTIAHRALALARGLGSVHEEQVFVIGDTPHDVECANAIGVRTIAVATGGYSVDELMPHAPWRVFEELPPPEEFVRLIAEPRVAAGPTERG